jgi:hypothetical protein
MLLKVEEQRLEVNRAHFGLVQLSKRGLALKVVLAVVFE